MAGSTEASEDQKSEVGKIKEIYGKQCKVIKDIGEFSHVVEVKLGESDCSVKFQLEGSYPAVAPHIIVKCGGLSALDREQLSLHLSAEAAHLTGQEMIHSLVNSAKLWAEERGLDLTPDTHNPREQRSPRTSPRIRKARRHNKMKSEDEVWRNEKLPSMKTSMDVVSRILWDDQLPQHCFVIGYLDRHLGVIEKNFSAFSWEDICTVDYNTLAIPKHRIQYFLYQGVKVWEKKSRLDNVFGSSGSGVTIYDVIAKRKEEAASRDANAEELPAQARNNETDDDDDDDDIEIHVGNQDSDDSDDATDTSELTKREKYWGKKNRPTHFLCLRITDPEIQQNIANTHVPIKEVNPDYDDCLIPAERLHITLACLGLDTEEQVQRAAQVLEEIKPEMEPWNPSDIRLKFSGTDHFHHSCIYAKVESDYRFTDMVEHLRAYVKEAGIEIRDVFEFTPHMTIMKMKKRHGHDFRCRYLDTTRVFDALVGNSEFGTQTFNNIYLCEMSEERQPDGFYTSPAHVHF